MKKKFLIFIFSFACVSTLLSQTSTGFESLDYLYSISGKYTLAGQKGREYWKLMRRTTGDYPALWGEDLLFSPGDGTASMDDWRSLVVHDAKQRWAQGALISMMFNACPPTQPEPCDWWNDVLNSNSLSDAQWNELITDGTALNNNWKARLDVIYPYLKELNDAGVELLFRPLQEMNQGEFWWGGRKGSNGTLKLYQITHDYLVKTKGLTNLIWVWDLQDFSTLSTDLDDYDPGSEYWDVLALDVYGTDGNRYTAAKYNLIRNKAAGKPIAIGECDVLPSSGELYSQPDWTFFMGWAELTQENNTDATIDALYNASNVLTLGETGREPVVSGNQNPLMLCNFDDVFPFISTSGLSISYAEAPAGSLASGQMGVVQVPADNTGNFFAIWDDGDPFDPRDYAGISFFAQADVSSPVPFALQAEQSITSNDIAQIQDWGYNYSYTGNGAWQEVHIGFDAIKTDLANKLAQNPALVASDYDRIAIVPAHYQTRPAFTLNIDDVRLRASWNDAGIPLTISADPVLISVDDKTISAKAASGNLVTLKAYSISGQEIAGGVNQVQVGAKGVYVVKATAGNISQVSKVVVQ